MAIRKEDLERLISKIGPGPINDPQIGDGPCKDWLAGISRTGTPIFTIGGKSGNPRTIIYNIWCQEVGKTGTVGKEYPYPICPSSTKRCMNPTHMDIEGGTIFVRFWRKVDKENGPIMTKYDIHTRCWLWTCPLVRGYGMLWYKGRDVGAHKVAYLENIGPIPEGKVVRHLCHVKHCVNPEHLILGSQKDNVGDMDRAGRRAPPRSLKERLELYTRPNPHNDCLDWTGPTGRRGVGRLRLPGGGKAKSVRRIAYECATGRPLSDSDHVLPCSKTGRKECINPDHLTVETQAERDARRAPAPEPKAPVLSAKEQFMAFVTRGVLRPGITGRCKGWGGKKIFRGGRAVGQPARLWYRWEIGLIPDGMGLVPICGSPDCIRPSHQELTPVNAKLTWPIVRAIRAAYASGALDQMELAYQYDLANQTVSDIINNKLWKDSDYIPPDRLRSNGKLPKEAVKAIKAAPAGVSNTKLAKKYDVNQSMISRIRTGKRHNKAKD